MKALVAVTFTLAMVGLASLSSPASRLMAHAEDQFVYLSGEVMHPARYTYEDEMTVARLIDKAGGFARNDGGIAWRCSEALIESRARFLTPRCRHPSLQGTP